jgi:uncharacterized protein (TIGR02145 family)
MRKTIYVVNVLMLLCAVGSSFGQKVSDEARRYFDRGMAAVEMAKTPADYEKAIAEFEKAKSLSPHWPDVYYNLGLIQDKAGMYSEAMENLRRYLLLAPNAKDAEAVRTLINKLDYKKEQIGDKYGKFTDPRDGKIYKTVKIGNQVWMAENLAYKTQKGSWAYNNDENNAKIYGYLYEWEAANNACPPGWHLPTKAEWETLISNLGSEPGNKMKSTRVEEHSCVGTNQSGFGAVFHRKEDSRSHIIWWSCSLKKSSSLFEKDKVWVPALPCSSGRVDWYRADPQEDNRFAIRCIRN